MRLRPKRGFPGLPRLRRHPLPPCATISAFRLVPARDHGVCRETEIEHGRGHDLGTESLDRRNKKGFSLL